MATGGTHISGSISLTSDETFEFICTPCARDGNDKEAVKYCTACGEYFCTTCIEFHNKFPGMSGHRDKLLGQDEMRDRGPQKPRVTLTEKCTLHEENLVEMFCHKHDQIGCNTCMTLEHRSCKDLDYIPLVATGIGKSPELKQVKEDLEKVKKNMIERKSSLLHDQIRIGEKNGQIKITIEEYRVEINKILDKLEKSTIKEAARLYNVLNSQIQNNIDTCDDIIKSTVAWLKQFETTDGRNEPQMFINIKKANEDAKKTNKIQDEMSKTSMRETITFNTESGIKDLLNGLTYLGKFSSGLHQHTETKQDQPSLVGDDKPKRQVDQHNQQKGSETSQSSHCKDKGSDLHTMTNGRDVNIRIKEDDKGCDINGICQLPDGRILLSDKQNNRLKLLEFSLNVIDHHDFPYQTYGMCVISDREVAVARGGQIIEFVSCQNKIVRTRKIKCEHWCYGIAYKNDELYVTSGKEHVYVYTKDGTLLRRYPPDNTRERLLSDNIGIAVSDNGRRLYVANKYGSLVTLDIDGNVLWKLDDSVMRCVGQICLDTNQNIIVCDSRSGAALKISQDGQVLGELLEKSAGMPYQTVCFDYLKSRIILSSTKLCDHVKVFDWKQ